MVRYLVVIMLVLIPLDPHVPPPRTQIDFLRQPRTTNTGYHCSWSYTLAVHLLRTHMVLIASTFFRMQIEPIGVSQHW